MKIIVDATSLARTITGIENYTKNLVLNLIDIKNEEFELILLFRNEIPIYLREKQSGYKALVSPFRSQLLTEQIWIPYVVKKLRPDLTHFPAFPPPLLVKNNIVFTIFDATMWKHTNTLSLKNKLYMRPLSTRGIRIAEKLFTISESSKKEILNVFPNSLNKMKNLGISISDNFQIILNEDELKNTKVKFQIPDKFLLTVGSLEPRKNLLFLIRSFIKFKKDNLTDFKLVITGRSAWGSNEVKELISKNSLEKDIILTGYIEDEELLSLYNLATYFLFPSIYEGFGLPVLEAMACGTPVIISNTSSLPEVAGDAALYIDPFNEGSLVSAMVEAIRDEKLYNDLRSKGLKRVALFSWKKVAQDIFNEYSNISRSKKC
jgi:glycosyltransferase involved in cell wall biosynthesis